MKKYIYYLLLLSSLSSFAQGGIINKSMFSKRPLINLENFDKQRLRFGFFLGLNMYDFKIDKVKEEQDIIVDSQMGFNVGLIANLRLTEHLDLRFEPGLQYGQRNLRFPNINDPVDALREVKSTYLHFPLLLKMSATRVGNIKPFLLAGVSTDLNLSSNANSLDDNSSNRFRMLKNTNNYELGAGIDIYFEYFKFSPSIRGVFGINNELIPDKDPNSPWTGNMEAIKTRGIFLNFAFQ